MSVRRRITGPTGRVVDNRWLVLGLFAIGAGACSKVAFDFNLLPCEAGRCGDGYDCHPEQGVCVRHVAVDCRSPSSATCPSKVETGSSCPSEGSFLPCADTAIACEQGCRTCGAGLTWGACPCTNASAEICNNLDDDCDGVTDNGLGNCQCTSGDPGTETCDGNDNDCDAVIDNVLNPTADCDLKLGTPPNVDEFQCAAGSCAISRCVAAYVDTNQIAGDGCEDDCVPSNGGVEICDTEDNDCNGTVDDAPQDATGCVDYYLDTDHDGFGSGGPQCWCTPSGDLTAAVGGDCAPGDATSYPGATEVCDGNDNDCVNGTPANEIDADGDRYVICTGWNDTQSDNPTIQGGGDCAAGDPTSYPGATEVCDGNDNDCVNGIAADETDADLDLWVVCTGWSDSQGDNPAIQGGGDCPVSDAAHHPGVTEICNNLDDNCSGVIDDSPLTAATCKCANGGTPAAGETCGNGIDDDCNNAVDDGCVVATVTVSDRNLGCDKLLPNTSNQTLIGVDVGAALAATTLTGITFRAHPQSTTTFASQISNVRLYRDNNGDGLYDGGDTLVDGTARSFSGSPATVTFSGLAEPLAAGSTLSLILVADVTLAANGTYLAVQMTSIGDFTVGAGDKVLSPLPLLGDAHAVSSLACSGLTTAGSAPIASVASIQQPNQSNWQTAPDDPAGCNNNSCYPSGSQSSTPFDCDLDDDGNPDQIQVTDAGNTGSRIAHINTGIPLGLPLCGLTMRLFATDSREKNATGCDTGNVDNRLFGGNYSSVPDGCGMACPGLDTHYLYYYSTGTNTSGSVSATGTGARTVTATNGPRTGDACYSQYVDHGLKPLYDAAVSSGASTGTFHVRFVVDTGGGLSSDGGRGVMHLPEIYVDIR
ncbi:MAG: putative metal-binding motif-containing protein [Deltaproteobacteria bacterium]|nr:putative metal-binding motif-containing protein [Deltaproteobacteria bacterium]